MLQTRSLLRLFWAVVLLSMGCAASVPPARAEPLGKVVGTVTAREVLSSVAWDPTDTKIATGTQFSRFLYLWDVASESALWGMRAYGMPLDTVHFSPDGTRILVPYIANGKQKDDPEAVITFVDTATGELDRTIGMVAPPQGINRAYDFAFAQDNSLLAAVSGPKMEFVSIYDTTDWSLRTILGPVVNDYRNIGGGRLVRLDSRRGFVIVSMIHGWAEVWDLNTNQKLREFRASQTGVGTMEYEPGKGILVTTTDGFDNLLADAPGLPLVRRKDDETKQIVSWDVQTGAPLNAFQGPGGFPLGLAISADGKYLFALRRHIIGRPVNSQLGAWDLATGVLVADQDLGKANAHGMALSHDGKFLAFTAGKVLTILQLNPEIFH